jgi:hypothetical protein
LEDALLMFVGVHNGSLILYILDYKKRLCHKTKPFNYLIIEIIDYGSQLIH